MSGASSEPAAIHQASPSPSSSPQSPSSSDRPRQSRIHFPADTVLNVAKELVQSKPAGSGLRSLEPRYPHPLSTSGNSPDDEFFAERRRVLSVNADASDASRRIKSSFRAQPAAGPSRRRTFSKRAASYSISNTERSNRGGTTSLGSSPLSARTLLPSDDDVPDQDDPDILADLRKALQYKPRVEQHLKESKANPDLPTSFPAQNTSSISSSNPFISRSPTMGQSEPSTPMKTDFVDFSPSVGKAVMHPVPTSTDDGATLDWSGVVLDEEKRERKWTIPLSRKPSKDKHPILSRKRLMERQASLYHDKLELIKDGANPHTLRKAEITKNQLQRRYAVLNASFAPNATRLNLVDVARWFSKQDDTVRSLISDAEPMSWVRHLLLKRGGKQSQRLPWNLSAMIVDEYVRSNSDAGFIHPMSQNSSMVEIASDAGSSMSATQTMQHSISRPTSSHSADYVTTRRKSDDLISFEPIVHSRRDSVGTDSRASIETHLRRWGHSLTGRTNVDASPQSSLKDRSQNASLELPSTKVSPVNARSPLQNFGMRKRARRTPQNSDDGHSSAVDSTLEVRNEHQRDNSTTGKQERERRKGRFHLSLDLKNAQGSMDVMKTPAALSITDLRTDAQPFKGLSLLVEGEAGRSSEAVASLSPPRPKLSYSTAPNSTRKSEQKKASRLSLPPTFRTSSVKRVKPEKRMDVQDHALRADYTRKKEILDALVSRNTQMRLLLQTTSRSIVDYDDTQYVMSERLGLSYSRLPPEVLEAFSHDPASTGGNTRRQKGWRSIEEVYLRRERQEDVLKAFVASIPESVMPLFLPNDSIYENAACNLTELVERLHNQRSTILSQVRQTNELLIKAKRMRDDLKPEFDETNRLTSANYPELVRLETLLDEFDIQKNRLWRLGEASLSFVLTSVAPLMKTFGRPIWDELHDFLVIPIYRNGFSGEDKWYPVSFPKRSFPHLLRLSLLACGAPLCLLHGLRFFVNLLTHGYNLHIPSFVPSSVENLLFLGVMFALAFFLLVLLVAVLFKL
ncbi:hypothetical protein EW145_g1894 [Phellinidium pouzarii]|uniref:Uncharacterized protein n=1 Tax=Phellinidium pouzarii TaxID=167371 RepID=A0A4V3XDF9_9AGAM|nr:hypothetical protein EW145_g1894 [Phellinidium pouzarii]